MPRFKGENFERNIELVRTLKPWRARARDGRRARAGVGDGAGRGHHSIPGTTRSEHLDELIDATASRCQPPSLTPSSGRSKHAVAGDRYMANMRAFIDH
jgi:hypothetical protein